MDKYDAYEKYLDFEEEYSPSEQNGHKKSWPKAKKKPTKALAGMSDFDDDASAWIPTYAARLDPLHHERQWLIDSLTPFYRDTVITDVIRRVKGGKEANVYCCVAHPTAEVEYIAAKLYRPRILRTLKNDAIYKAGRQLRGEDGKQLKGRREKLALQQKTRFGQHLDMVWWIGNEYLVQKKLHEAGAKVPRPIGHNGNAILMDYLGDGQLPAPTLSDVSLSRAEAADLFEQVMENVRIMLDNHFVHGDLSAFNILYWEGDISIIDFPQVVNARINPNAFMLLQRDIKRVCDYFGRFYVVADPRQLATGLWEPYMGSL